MKGKGFFQRLWRRIKIIFIILFVGQLIYIVALKWVDPPITVTQLISLFSGYGMKRDYIKLNEMSPNIRLAVIAHEDQMFPDHNGFDVKSIEKALTYNTKKPGRVRGASTISQQVAKNVFLWQGRSWMRKGLEVYFTFMIETIWGKERILEMYLNVAEMGRGVFGIEAASYYYFKKSAKKLTKNEAAKIAACLPNPKVYGVNPPSAYIAKRYPWVVRQMNNLEGDKDLERFLK